MASTRIVYPPRRRSHPITQDGPRALCAADLDRDGDLDLLHAMSHADVVGWAPNPLYVDLGHALAGIHGAPHLGSYGPLVAGSETWIRLTDAREGSATTLLFQAWIVDPLGPAGFAASNGLAGTTPP